MEIYVTGIFNPFKFILYWYYNVRMLFWQIGLRVGQLGGKDSQCCWWSRRTPWKFVVKSSVASSTQPHYEHMGVMLYVPHYLTLDTQNQYIELTVDKYTVFKIGHSEMRHKSHLESPYSIEVLKYSWPGFSIGMYIDCVLELRYADDMLWAHQDSGGVDLYEKPNLLWNVVMPVCLNVSKSCAYTEPPASFAAKVKASCQILSQIGLLSDWTWYKTCQVESINPLWHQWEDHIHPDSRSWWNQYKVHQKWEHLPCIILTLWLPWSPTVGVVGLCHRYNPPSRLCSHLQAWW